MSSINPTVIGVHDIEVAVATCPTTNVPHLPNELLIKICRELGSQSSAHVTGATMALQNFRLASHAFAEMGATPLFGSVKVSARALVHNRIDLAKPPSAEHVQRLVVELRDDNIGASMAASTFVFNLAQFFSSIEALGLLLPRVREMQISLCYDYLELVNQITLPRNVSAAHVDFTGYEPYSGHDSVRITSLITDMTALTRLSIGKLDLKSLHHPLSLDRFSAPALQHLQLENLHLWTDMPSVSPGSCGFSEHVASIPGLQSLKLNVVETLESWDTMFRSLSQHNTTMTELHLNFVQPTQGTISSAGRITHIPLHLRVLKLEQLGDLTVEHLMGLVSGSQQHLEAVTLRKVKLTECSHFDIVPILDKLMDCPQLRRVHLSHIKYDRPVSSEYDNYELVRDHWHTTSSRETLDIHEQQVFRGLVVLTEFSVVHHKVGELIRHLYARGGTWGQEEPRDDWNVLPFLTEYYGTLWPMAEVHAQKVSISEKYPWDETHGVRVQELARIMLGDEVEHHRMQRGGEMRGKVLGFLKR